METTRPPGFPGNPPARMPRAPTPARSPPPRPLRRGEMTFRPTHDVGPRTQCISGLNYAAYGLPVNASRPGSPQAHASLGSGWRPTLAGWDWIPTGFRTRFRRSHHVLLSPLTGLSRHTRSCIRTVKLARSMWLVEIRASFGLPEMNLGVVDVTLADGRNQSGPSVLRVVLDELREVDVRPKHSSIAGGYASSPSLVNWNRWWS